MAIKLSQLAVQLEAIGASQVKAAMDDIGKEAKTVGKNIADLVNPATSVKTALAGIASVFAVAAVGAFFKGTVTAAGESEQSIEQLRQAVNNAGGNFDLLRPKLDAAAQGILQLTKYSEEAARGALATLIEISGDTKGSLKNLGIVADFAAAKHLDLNEAAVLVGKAMIGNTKALKKMGIEAEAGSNIMDTLSRRFKGFAAGEADTFLGRLDQIGNAWNEVKISIGGVIIGMDDQGGHAESLRSTLLDMAKSINDNSRELNGYIHTAIDAGVVIGSTLKNTFIVLAGAIALAAHGVMLFVESLAVLATGGRFGTLDRLKKKMEDFKTTAESMKKAGQDWAATVNESEQRRAGSKNRDEATAAADDHTAAMAAVFGGAGGDGNSKKRGKTADGLAKEAEAAKKASEELNKRIELLGKALVYEDLRASALKQLAILDRTLSQQYAAGNVPLETRIDLELKLDKIHEERAKKFINTQPTGPTVSVANPFLNGQMPMPESTMPKVPESIIKPIDEGANAVLFKKQQEIQTRVETMMNDLATTLRQGIAQTLGDAIYNGFAAAFSGKGLDGAMKAFGKTLLAGVGSIITDLGKTWLMYGILMTTLGAALWNPFTSGPAAIAIGAALIALGGALGGIAHGGSTRGTASAGAFREPSLAGQDLTRLKFVNRDGSRSADITPVKPVTFNVFGPNDPKAQRAIVEAIDKYKRRAA